MSHTHIIRNPSSGGIEIFDYSSKTGSLSLRIDLPFQVVLTQRCFHLDGIRNRHPDDTLFTQTSFKYPPKSESLPKFGHPSSRHHQCGTRGSFDRIFNFSPTARWTGRGYRGSVGLRTRSWIAEPTCLLSAALIYPKQLFSFRPLLLWSLTALGTAQSSSVQQKKYTTKDR